MSMSQYEYVEWDLEQPKAWVQKLGHINALDLEGCDLGLRTSGQQMIMIYFR